MDASGKQSSWLCSKVLKPISSFKDYKLKIIFSFLIQTKTITTVCSFMGMAGQVVGQTISWQGSDFLECLLAGSFQHHARKPDTRLSECQTTRIQDVRSPYNSRHLIVSTLTYSPVMACQCTQCLPKLKPGKAPRLAR